VAGGLLLVSLIVAVVAYSRPTHTPSHRNVAYAQHGTFGYTASAAVGPVYPTGTATTGDPLFVSLVQRALVSFRYRLTSTAPQAVGGRGRLDAELTSSTGWRRTWTLAPAKSFSGGDVTLSAPLDLSSLESLLNSVAAATGSPFQSYTLTIHPHVT